MHQAPGVQTSIGRSMMIAMDSIHTRILLLMAPRRFLRFILPRSRNMIIYWIPFSSMTVGRRRFVGGSGLVTTIDVLPLKAPDIN